jgi:hypothetical protein
MSAHHLVHGSLILGLCTLALAQQPLREPAHLASEPHHQLLLENTFVRVYRLTLQPGEATLPHRHEQPYVFVSLERGKVANEVRGRQPIVSELGAGELRTSKGGFALAERNVGQQLLNLIVVEQVKKADAGAFEEPMIGFRYHDAAFGPLFEAPMMRGYDAIIASQGRTEKHLDKYDRLLIALSNIELTDQIEGTEKSNISQKVGGVVWLPSGAEHSTVNIGEKPAHFVTIEFR